MQKHFKPVPRKTRKIPDRSPSKKQTYSDFGTSAVSTPKRDDFLLAMIGLVVFQVFNLITTSEGFKTADTLSETLKSFLLLLYVGIDFVYVLIIKLKKEVSSTFAWGFAGFVFLVGAMNGTVTWWWLYSHVRIEIAVFLALVIVLVRIWIVVTLAKDSNQSDKKITYMTHSFRK